MLDAVVKRRMEAKVKTVTDQARGKGVENSG